MNPARITETRVEISKEDLNFAASAQKVSNFRHGHKVRDMGLAFSELNDNKFQRKSMLILHEMRIVTPFLWWQCPSKFSRFFLPRRP
jgi:hypothetical protein